MLSSVGLRSFVFTRPIIVIDSCSYNGVCDKDGCDFASYRLGDRSYYGNGGPFQVKSIKIQSKQFTASHN